MSRANAPCGPDLICIDDAREPDGVSHEAQCPSRVPITVQQIEDGGPGTLRPRSTMFVAHGPGGYTWLLKRMTPEAAVRDGRAYFMSTHVLHQGRWYIADEHGAPLADANGKRFVASEAAARQIEEDADAS